MRRRYNYTGRKRIKRSQVLIAVTDGDNGEPASFDLELELDNLDLPDDAMVLVEAYHGREYMRFECGTVASMRPPMDRRLLGITFPDRLLFRVKVLGADGEAGLILAMANQLRPDRETKDERRSILPIQFSDKIGEAIWRLDMEKVTEPLLIVNSQIDNIENIVKHDPAFAALVWPNVVQEVITQLLLAEGGYGDDAVADWKHHWIRFVEGFFHIEPPEPDSPPEVKLKWRDEVVDKFCDRLQPRRKYEEGRQ